MIVISNLSAIFTFSLPPKSPPIKAFIHFPISHLLIITLLLCSCQKEISSTISSPSVNPPVSSRDTPLVARYIQFNGPNFTDTIISFAYSYDNLKRITKKDIRSIISFATPGNPSVIEIFHFKFLYNGTDTLATQMPFTFDDDQVHDNDTIFLSYNANGQMLRDSITGDSSFFSGVTRFQYVGNTIISYYTDIGQPMLIENRQNTYSNGDLVRERISSSAETKDNLYTYDLHPNPLYRTTLRFPIITGGNVFDPQQSHNLTQTNLQTTNSSGPQNPEKYLYTYTYRPDGYPLSVIIHNLFDPTYPDVKGVYIYQ